VSGTGPEIADDIKEAIRSNKKANSALFLARVRLS
jgi:hypothetical protein